MGNQSIQDAARGNWFQILTGLGVPPQYLSNKHGPCPFCGGKDRWRWDNKDESGSGYCGQCGAGDGFNLAGKHLGLDSNKDFPTIAEKIWAILGVPSNTQLKKKCIPKTVDKRKVAEKIWQNSLPFDHKNANLASLYFNNRGLKSHIGSAELRFSSSLRYYEGFNFTRHPGIVARISDVNGRFCTILQIFLDSKGKKASLENPKKILSKIQGGVVKLYEPTNTLALAEGIETALAVKEATGLPTWATINDSGLKNFTFPNGVKIIHIWMDLDRSAAGEKAATSLATRLTNGGLTVFIHQPPGEISTDKKSLDWLDILNRFGSEKFKLSLDEKKQFKIGKFSNNQIKEIQNNTLQKTSPAPIVLPPAHSTERISKRATKEDYFPFFKEHLNPKLDIFSRKLVTYSKTERRWLPSSLYLDALGARAIETGLLKKNHLKEYLALYKESFKPELIINIPKWDNRDRIREMVNCLNIKNVTNDIAYELVCDWCSKIFGRIYDPYIQNRILILKGPQGIGKDTWFQNLLDGFGQFFANILLTHADKDNLLTVHTLAVAIISEFDRSAKVAIGSFKNLISTSQITFRMPYERDACLRDFRCSFAATVNVDEILRDTTGNRRYMILEVDSINWTYSKDDDYKIQLLAQMANLQATNFQPSKIAEKSMEKYIEIKTPIDEKDILLEIWDQKISNLGKDCSPIKKYYSSYEISGILNELRQTFHKSANEILSFVKNNNRSKRSSNGTLYFKKDSDG